VGTHDDVVEFVEGVGRRRPGGIDSGCVKLIHYCPILKRDR
jgi:hypothetical protein